MHTHSSSQQEDPNSKPGSPGEMQESIYQPQHELNITDGGEFLDDDLRMKDQPLGETTVKENEEPFAND